MIKEKDIEDISSINEESSNKTKKNKKHIICIVTKVHGIYGHGHSSRMLVLANAIAANGGGVCFISDDKDDPIYELARQNAFNSTDLASLNRDNVSCIIIDKRESSIDYMKKLKEIAPVIIIDSNGHECKIADVVIQMFPSIHDNADVNIKPYDYTILNLPKNIPSITSDRILVYVGGVKDLMEYLIDVFSNIKEHNFDIVADSSIIDNNLPLPKNIFVKPFSNTIYDKTYKAAITYFGLTAFECCSLRIPVALISPTDYHAILTKKNEDMFFDIGGFYKNLDKRKAKDNIRYFLRSSVIKSSLIKNTRKINASDAIKNFLDIIENIKNNHDIICDVCSNHLTNIISRRNISNLYRCEKCKTIKQVYFGKLEQSYDKSYFVANYKNQYGRSYEEDSSTLRLLARNRLDEIKKIKPEGNILELGSAMGFFLSEAKNYGYTAKGIEISAYAVSYAKSKLDVDIKCKSLENFEYKENEYDIICAWYVLEHLPTLIDLIDKLYISLKKGGILAFAMPNGYGITAIKKKDYYANLVPVDHVYEFSVKSIDMLLSQKGFVRVKNIAKGIHVSRFVDTIPKMFSFLNKSKMFNILYKRTINLLKLGDTFEAYYIKR